MNKTTKKIIGRSFITLVFICVVILFFDFTFMPYYINKFYIFVICIWGVLFTAWGIAPDTMDKYYKDYLAD